MRAQPRYLSRPPRPIPSNAPSTTSATAPQARSGKADPHKVQRAAFAPAVAKGPHGVDWRHLRVPRTVTVAGAWFDGVQSGNVSTVPDNAKKVEYASGRLHQTQVQPSRGSFLSRLRTCLQQRSKVSDTPGKNGKKASSCVSTFGKP